MDEFPSWRQNMHLARSEVGTECLVFLGLRGYRVTTYHSDHMCFFGVVQGFLKEVKRWKWNKFQAICLGIPEKKTKKSQKWSKFIESDLFVPCRGRLCFRVQFWLAVLCFASFVCSLQTFIATQKLNDFSMATKNSTKPHAVALITSSHDVILCDFPCNFFGLFGGMEPTHVCLIYYMDSTYPLW